MQPKRCDWVSDHEIYKQYHDNVWGRPVTNSQELFAKLCLDGQQAGLSWLTILKKAANYDQAFYQFDPVKISKMDEHDIERLMTNSGIIRNRLKINAIIKNAKAYLNISKSVSFSDYIWQFTDHKTLVNHWQSVNDVPASTPVSDKMAKTLKKDGFSFVGTTICYAFMQAVGMVNDHTTDCHCYHECVKQARN